MPYSLEFEGIILSGFSKTVIDCSQKLADPNNCCPITPKLSNKPWAYKFDTGAGADNCDPIIKRRTEKGWTLDFIFNRENLSWAFGGVFYYLGVRGDNDPNNYADNNLSFQFTSDRKIKWVAHHYSGYCATDLGYQEVFYTASGLTPTICATDETKDFNVTITFDRYKHYTDCDIENDGGWNDLLPGPHLIPYTSTDTGVTSTHISTGYYLTNSTGSTLSGETEVYVYTEELNKKWANERQRRLGTLKIYLNGRPIYKLEDWEEVIPSSRGVQPFIQSWGGGTGLMNNIHYGVCCFNMKSIKYYEEPLDFVHVRHNFLTRLSDYDFNICGGPCEDEISGFVPNPSPTSTSTPTLTPTHTPSSTPTRTPTPTPTLTSSSTSTPTPTPTLTTSSTSTPTPTPTLTSSSTPTPTPTATQDLVIFNLDIEVSSGSIIVDFIANASQELNQDTDISVMVSLNLINEEILDVESVVTILSGQTSGTTRVEVTGRTFDELDLTGNLSVGQIILNGKTYEVFAELNFITPIPNNDFTYVIIPDNNLVYTIIPNNDLTYRLIPSNDLTYITIPGNDVSYIIIPNNDLTNTLIPNNDLISALLPNNDLEYLVLPNNDVNYTLIPNPDSTYTLIPNNDVEFTVLKPPTVFYGEITLGEDSVEGTCNCAEWECPRFYVTGDGPTFCESNIFVITGGGTFFSGWGTIVHNGFYKTVNMDGTNIATYRTDCGACPTTPTPTPTPTPTTTPTPTPTPSTMPCSSPYQINLIDRTAEGSGAFGTNLSLARQSANGFNDGSLHPGGWGMTYFKNSAPQVGDYIYTNTTCTNAATNDGYYIISINGTYRVVQMASSQIVLVAGDKDGLTSETAGDSAYQIKTDYPSSTDGLYWIKNSNISGGTPFQIYADMTTDGGGWTLIMSNGTNNGWTYQNSILLNEGNPSISGSNYSIISYANYLKKSGNSFQYMIEANVRNSFGAIWSAPQSYSFVNTDNTQTNVTINTKFGTWSYFENGGISQRMPWYANSEGFITTSTAGGGYWWGTLITASGGWNTAPWMELGCGTEGCMERPSRIWYWVR